MVWDPTREGELIMLVVMSDLHFVDGTAGDHNLPFSAFESVFLSDIVSIAKRKKATEIKLVLAGDIFDLIRTDQWLSIDLEDRPWGKNGMREVEESRHGTPTEQRCLDIVGTTANGASQANATPNTIVDQNWDTFAFFRDFKSTICRELQKQEDDFNVEIIYLPGNHDRMVNLYPVVRDRVAAILGLPSPPHWADKYGDQWWYPYLYTDEQYGVFIRHGHQYSSANFAGDNFARSGHLTVPVGDIITTEFAVRLPWELNQELKDFDTYGVSDAKRQELVTQLKEIDNVRPMSSVLEWVYYQTKRDEFRTGQDAMKVVLERVIRHVAGIRFSFNRNFAPKVVEKALDIGRMILKRWVPEPVITSLLDRNLLPFIIDIHEGTEDPFQDKYAKAAYQESIWKENPEIRFICYGHTHNPVNVCLDRFEKREIHYINLGLWRERIHKSILFDEKPDFVKLKHMTYAVFYNAEEDKGTSSDDKKTGTPSFDVWTGSKHKMYEKKKPGSSTR
jgi:UDP-2,3-diacylglucosamine pyrophosphatase LpxH